MIKYIIRLDDACPNMNKKNWDRIESLLDKYNIKPIVGIIPDCKDEELLQYKKISDFWNKYANNWERKKWIIAQHGLNHNLSSKIRTEYCGKDYINQRDNIQHGNKILKQHGIIPTCFFAPAHTFDNTTIKVCKDLSFFDFISDGVALYPYNDNGVVFLPNIFDTPHKILPFGIYTFVYHPNKMVDSDFIYLENFLKKNFKYFNIDISNTIKKYENRKRNILDYFLYYLIKFYRKLKNTKR
ncbi:MAG: DUF2334 domain-containing protein [Firmicutes bacterium]|nr:DUF2334 domain-containing protein [Bacillota bacterium]